MFAMFPFRVTILPFGYYFGNGDRYDVSSPQGVILLGLPNYYKTDWGITVVGTTINVPKLFAADGRGYFFRAADTPGVEQGDAIRNIKSDVSNQWNGFVSHMLTTSLSSMNPFFDIYKAKTGATWVPNKAVQTVASNGYTFTYFGIDVSLSVPTADENRPINKSLVPAIWLGV
jgi:hypothetical protein